MRVAIATRIFAPEVAAASFRLAALANALEEAGHLVTVLTVRPPSQLAIRAEVERRETTNNRKVKRWPVLRDSSGYVRGYLQYMSFDIPLFFRILFGAKQDLIVAEPPPTSGFFVRLAAFLRRTPYAYYAADIWSDASSQTGAPEWVVRAVRGIERFALRGAQVVLSVSEGVTIRLAELGITAGVETIGNGVDAAAFTGGLKGAGGGAQSEPPTFVYAGTASEWHGAQIFIEALPAVLKVQPMARLRFIGGGSEREAIELRAAELGIENSISFDPAMQPAEIAPLLASSAGALASVRPGSGYDFAFPTKLYSAAVCGAPLIYSGVGPAVEFVRIRVDGLPLGVSVPALVEAVTDAMLTCLMTPTIAARRERVAQWAQENVSLDAVAAYAARCLMLRTAERDSV